MTDAPPLRDVVVVHSSDLHVDHDYTARLHGGDGTAGLAGVLRAARNVRADVLLLAGDLTDLRPEQLRLVTVPDSNRASRRERRRVAGGYREAG